MRRNINNFLKLIKIETEDIREDIELDVKNCQKRWEERDITEHIYGENMAVFRNQLHGVELFQRILSNIDSTEFSSIEDIINSLHKRFEIELRHTGLFPCIGSAFERKLRKVQRSLEALNNGNNTEIQQ